MMELKRIFSMKRYLALFLITLFWGLQATASLSFTVSDIRIEGLQQVSPGVVFRNFPISTGDQISQGELTAATRELFRSGFFEDVQLLRDEGDVLVVRVRERPSVALIRIDGNKAIKEEQLREGLRQAGLQEGDVFRRAALDQISLELLRVYGAQGRYSADIDTEVEYLSGNRVALNVNIREGRIATIQHINIVGNSVYSNEELTGLFSLSLPGMFNFFTKTDEYSREKLAGDLERLRSHYLDNGYINFAIDSAQVSITPDKRHVYITIDVTEGEQYTVREISLVGNLVLPEDELQGKITIEQGDVFSRREMTDIQERLVNALGDQGYMFANISPMPELHDDNTVSVRYFIEPGRQTFVRRINIRGNTRTADEVIRRELEQMEAGVASTRAIERSRTRLDQTGYFREVNVETRAVAGTDDQVDLDYSVEEAQLGQLSASIGFSQSDGIILDFGVSQDNFIGTGKSVSFNISNSKTRTEYSFDYLDPYYTVDGVSRGFNLYYRERDFEEDDISTYTTDEIGGGVTFGYPIDDYQRLTFSGDVEYIRLNTYERTATEVIRFIEQEGDDFLNWKLTAGWSYNKLNRALFPTRGFSQGATLEMSLPGSDLGYYRAQYNNRYFHPIDRDEDWVVGLRSRVGYADAYGSNAFPFFKNYFAGGLRTVRGYDNNSLGPRDSNNDALGGNVLISGSAELIFPIPFLRDKTAWRTLLFMDAGNVYTSKCLVSSTRCSSGIELGDLRYSVGVGLSWLTPIGPLSISLGKGLNSKSGDDEQVFQFALGQTF